MTVIRTLPPVHPPPKRNKMQTEVAIGRIVKLREHLRRNSVYVYGRIQRTTPQFYVIDIEYKDTPNLNYNLIPHHGTMRVRKNIATDIAKYNMTVLEHYPNAEPAQSTGYDRDVDTFGGFDVRAYLNQFRTLFNLIETADAEVIRQLHASASLMERLRMMVEIADATGMQLSPTHPIHTIIASHSTNRSTTAKNKLVELCDELKTANKMSETDYECVMSYVKEGAVHNVLDVFEDLNEKQKINEGEYLRACNVMRDI